MSNSTPPAAQPSAFRTALEKDFFANGTEVTESAKVWLDYALSTNKRGAEVVQTLLTFVPSLERLRVLDVGSGYGGVCIAAARVGATAEGIEIDARLLKFAHLNRSESPNLGVEFHAISAMDWSALAPLGQFDVITCDNVIEHVPVPPVLIIHLRRLLKPGGLLYLTVPNAFSFGQIAKECHFGQFGLSLLDPVDGQAFLREQMPWATYDVSHYYRLGAYQELLTIHGLAPRLLNSVAAADEEVANAERARDELVRQRAQAHIPAPFKAKVDGLIDAHLACFDADVALFRSLPPGLERTEFGHWLARTYLTELWYFVARPGLPPPEPMASTTPTMRAVTKTATKIVKLVKRQAATIRRRLARRSRAVVQGSSDMTQSDVAKSANDEIEKLVKDESDRYFEENHSSPEEQAAHRFDHMRHVRSLVWLSSLDLKNKRILNLGGPCLSTRIINRYFSLDTLTYTEFELRTRFPYPDHSFDIVISQEVIEHIFDIEIGHATTLTGVKHVLDECRRVLAPGGTMFLTTPNASSTWIIQRALLQQPPMVYEPHFREFTFVEMKDLIAASGFELARAGTEKVWHHLWNFGPIEEFMRNTGYSLEDRGDDTFVIARKP
ncbi:MAG: methyltransferase domain-containing protein [Proteobacteria bacterium]|nr:methyltransferase domain-containing protein [Pseudomonadota bacterium]